MRGQDAQGSDALTADEQALFDASRDNSPPPAEPSEPAGGDEAASGAPDAAVDESGSGGEQEAPQGQAQQPAKMVPHQALHEERRARQETEKRLDDERKQRAVLEERMNILLRNMQQPQQEQQAQRQPEAAPIPDLSQDPVGHLIGQIGQLRNEIQQRDPILNALAQAVTGQNQTTEEQRAMQALAVRADAMEKEFEAQTPDYRDAYNYFIDGWRRELEASGWTDRAEMQLFMAREGSKFISGALQRGQNPAEVVYNFAKIRGYQPKQADPAPQPNAAASDQIATIQRGQDQARGLNGVRGQSPAPVTASAIANMSDTEFAAWAKKASPAEKRRVLGA